MASFLVKDKDFYGQMLKIAVPIAFQNMLTFAVRSGHFGFVPGQPAYFYTFGNYVWRFRRLQRANFPILGQKRYWGYPQGAGYHVPGGFGAGYSILHCGIVYARRLFKDIYYRPAGY